MNNTIYFLRHAQSVADSRAPQSTWLLSEVGLNQARDARRRMKTEFDVILSSAEQKAVRTAEIFVLDSSLEIQVDSVFNELNRDRGSFLSQADYNLRVKEAMTTSCMSVNGWETVQSALERFTNGVQRIDKEYTNKQILLVSHGIVLSLYFAALLNCEDVVYHRWLQLHPCSWGKVENGIVTIDIAK